MGDALALVVITPVLDGPPPLEDALRDAASTPPTLCSKGNEVLCRQEALWLNHKSRALKSLCAAATAAALNSHPVRSPGGALVRWRWQPKQYTRILKGIAG